jgi:EAL domain-containing protein (putative c-di-GMP-specific phosphodiesterase class I)
MLYEDAKEGLENALRAKSKVSFSNDSSIVASKEAKENLEMIKTVKIALDNFNIVSYFQPIINNKTKEIEKYESLVRLIDEHGNILSPFHFLNVSKKGNYYSKITQRVLENSFKILHTINTKLSINISVKDIEKEQTRVQIFTLLEEYKEDAHRIIFELLEDENVEDFNIIKDFIHAVKAKGVQIAIDDFGAGYSNFERILEFDPDIVKIDGSLVKNIATDLFSRNIVETIVSFAKKQNIETIAEYVENETIFNILNEIGVDYSQGYYFGKPEELS